MNAPHETTSPLTSPPSPKRVALLEVIGRDGRVAQTLDVPRWPLSLGRSLAADVVLDDPHVAASHATLRLDDAGRLVLDVGDTRNGVRQGARVHTGGSRVPVPPGGATWRIGGLTLRLRTPDEVLAAEVPLPIPGLGARPMLLMGLALAALALWNHWLTLDPGSELMDWLPLVAGLPVVLGLWAGLWATASKLFQHRFEFGAHLRLALPVALAVEALDSGLPMFAAALDLPLLWRLVAPMQLALLALLVHRHLALVLPQARQAVATFVGAAVLAGAAVAATSNWRSVDRWSRPPYMSTLPTPALLWRAPDAAEALVGDLEPLAAQLARRVQQARDEDPPESGADE